tara:strand:- start:653 stop:985 length:333 start_codon:yes stop_codon:yes gene_type:complete
MTKARDYTKTESGIQLMKQLGGGRGATKKGLIKNLKKLFVKQKTVKSQESLTRAGKDLKLKKAGVLKVQKTDTKHGPVHPGLGGKMVDKKPPDASLQRAINEWKKKKGKK